jgi:glycosyltransferase involved in cell wall biosynthesis
MGAALTDGVIAAAQKHRRDLCEKQGLKHERVVTVSPGINLSRTVRMQSADDPGSPIGKKRVVGIIAGLRPEKDHGTFLRAAAIVLQRFTEVEFHVIGDGPERVRLECLARELGVSANTCFLGWQEVNGRLLGTLDALALSSASETFPAVLLEAFNAGVPVVATDVGSVAELLGSPPCGLLVPPRNPEALGSALIRILEQRELAYALTDRARTRVVFFSADRFCSDMLQLVRKQFQNKHSDAER